MVSRETINHISRRTTDGNEWEWMDGCKFAKSRFKGTTIVAESESLYKTKIHSKVSSIMLVIAFASGQLLYSVHNETAGIQ